MLSVTCFILINLLVSGCQGRPSTSDRSHDEALMSDEEALYHLPRNGELFEGDIVMDDRLRRAVWGQQSKKSALRPTEKRPLLWPDGKVYYVIDPKFPPENVDMLHEAFKEYERRTCIQFIPRSNVEPFPENYIYYTADRDECSSSIGMKGGKQEIHLSKHCLVLGTFLHENMHALGFIHEHSRPDRDKYLDVKYKHIKKSEWNNFQKYSVRDVDTMNMDMNFGSIMLYRNDAFTKDGEDTLVAWEDPELKFGQRIQFSVGDVKEINKLYKCDEKEKHPDFHGLVGDVHVKERKDVKNIFMDYIKDVQKRVYLDEQGYEK